MQLNIFLQMKEGLYGHLYDWNEEVESTVRTWMKKQSVEFFYDDGFEKLACCLWKCVENSGDYVKK
jgi:hypothetical protein